MTPLIAFALGAFAFYQHNELAGVLSLIALMLASSAEPPRIYQRYHGAALDRHWLLNVAVFAAVVAISNIGGWLYSYLH